MVHFIHLVEFKAFHVKHSVKCSCGVSFELSGLSVQEWMDSEGRRLGPIFRQASRWLSTSDREPKRLTSRS